MRIFITFVLIMMLACQSKQKNTGNTENISEKTAEAALPVASKSGSNIQQDNEQCYTDVCLKFRNHNVSKKSFEIHMINTLPVFGFQCDFPGINIVGSDGGLLQESDFQTSNSASRILSFSMQARSIPIGEGVLTTIYYSDPSKEVCMTEIIFAGIGGTKLKNDIPECLKLY